ncbi:MAG: response regulator [Candidatus Lokiarchaeota archaeon]|nr:response regulator [Candidatus Lokiarchaeota archaeon]
MNFDKKIKPIEVLLVEDNPGDIRLTKEAMKEAKIINNLNVVEDGVEALAYLRKKGNFKGVKRPDLILLDINLPKKNGREVLAEIKQDIHLKQIPVVILTVSNAEEDIIKTYELHANCYITKPVDMEQFTKVVKSIDEFWFSIVRLPPNKNFH